MFVYQKTVPGQYIVSVDPREELLFEALCIELRYDIDHAFGTPTSEDIYRSSSSLTSPSPSSRSPGYSADDEKEDDVDSPKPQLVADNSTYSQALDAGVDVPGSD